jgi:hypothetical protein
MLKKHIALPQDHGSWVFLFSPLLIGIFAGGSTSFSTLFLVLSSIAVFLIRQPITIIIKIFSGRRTRRDLKTALFWSAVYGVIASISLAGLVFTGNSYVLFLAIPGVAVFSWHLWLVSRRSERNQIGVEIIASGVLALSAPAGYWVSLGKPDPAGWLLFLLTWLQSAASIVYAYLRLEQRNLSQCPTRLERFRKAQRSLAYSTFNILFVAFLARIGSVPPLLVLPYLVQWIETIWGTLRPAIGEKPTRIGMRQLIISSIFTILFIATWNIS